MSVEGEDSMVGQLPNPVTYCEQQGWLLPGWRDEIPESMWDMTAQGLIDLSEGRTVSSDWLFEDPID